MGKSRPTFGYLQIEIIVDIVLGIKKRSCKIVGAEGSTVKFNYEVVNALVPPAYLGLFL